MNTQQTVQKVKAEQFAAIDPVHGAAAFAGVTGSQTTGRVAG